MIEVTELYKYYGAKRALGPISFSVEQGQIVGLLGLNGAGKTTTLRILAGDLLATSGRVCIAGTECGADQDSIRASIGYLPDTPPLYGDMTVREYLLFAARLRNVPAKDARGWVAEVEDLTEIEAVSDERISSLSHGYRQRVGIAQAIVHKPALVLLDEPISGLDPVQIVEMRALVRNLRGKHTVVISSHILPEISETCDSLIVLRDGEIVAKGSERELSAGLLRGHRLELTVRSPAASDDASPNRLLAALPGVREVLEQPAAEPGERISSLSVVADADVREAACRVLVEQGFGILEMTRAHRELERVFLELSGSGGDNASEEPDDESKAQSEEAEA